MLDSLFKLIDPKKIGFRDKCSNDTQRVLGILCGAYVFLVIIGMIYISAMTILLFTECRQSMDTSSTVKVAIYSVFSLCWQVFIAIFMINACKMCNGLYAFFFIFAIGIVISIISILLLGNIQNIMMKCVKDKLK